MLTMRKTQMDGSSDWAAGRTTDESEFDSR